MSRVLRFLTLLFVFSFSISSVFANSSFSEVLDNITKNNYLETVRFKNFEKPLNRKQLAYLSIRLYEIVKDQKFSKGKVYFSDTYDPYVLAAKNYEILDGYPDGTFRPEKTVNRQELAFWITKIFRLFKKPTDFKATKKFSDDRGIAKWAKDSCYFADENGMIPSIKGKFIPLKSVTTKEAIIIFSKLVDMFAKKDSLDVTDEKTQVSSKENKEDYEENWRTGDVFIPTSLNYQEVISDEKQNGIRVNSFKFLTIDNKNVTYKPNSKPILVFVDGRFSFSFDIIKNILKTKTDRPIYVIDVYSSNEPKKLYKELGINTVVFDKNKMISNKFSINRLPSVLFINNDGIVKESVYGVCGVDVYVEALYRTLNG